MMLTESVKFLILSTLCLQSCSSRFYCVTPSYRSASFRPAPESGENCRPLYYYIQNVDKFFTTNVTFKFLAGVHILESNEAIHINNFALEGSSKNLQTQNTSMIKCQGTKKTGFHFSHGSQIRLENLIILGCGMVLFGHTRAALAFDKINSLAISSVNVTDSLGFGIHARQVSGNACDNIKFCLHAQWRR